MEEHSSTGLTAQEVVELLDTQTFFELLGLPYPIEQSGVIDRLEKERFIDLVEGFYAIRRIGGLLLPKRLKDFEDLARKAPRVVVYSGSSKLETRLEQTGVKGYAVGFQARVSSICHGATSAKRTHQGCTS